MFRPLKCHIFHSKLLLYNCKFHSIKDEQLDTITSLILLLLTLPSLCLISSKQTVSSNQCLCGSTGLKVIVAQDQGAPSFSTLIFHDLSMTKKMKIYRRNIYFQVNDIRLMHAYQN